MLHELKHFLPAQAPLKDFIHHNTLHAFQHEKFHKAIRTASKMFGYKVSFTLAEFRSLYQSKRIREDILEKVISDTKGEAQFKEWKQKVLYTEYPHATPRIGSLRSNWKKKYQIDLDSLVHPTLFRILCSYLDQGISMWNFPVRNRGFLASMQEIERNSFSSFFKSHRARSLLLQDKCEVAALLEILVGDESLYKQYLFDQQFGHPGWSGMVSTIEDYPEVLLDRKNISLHDLIAFETLLEIDALDSYLDKGWKPLAQSLREKPVDLFAEVETTERHEILTIWQEAYEWTYYDEVLAGLKTTQQSISCNEQKSFQAIFCIDDREASLRDYLEQFDRQCETFATPGFFNVEFFFKPEHGKFYTKQCPAPVTPKYLIKELGTTGRRKTDVHFTKHTHSLFRGWLTVQTLGFWSALRLILNIFRPTMSASTASSHSHMDAAAQLTILNTNVNDRDNALQVGFTVEEMANRVESLLKGIGLVKDFAPLVYVVGHGASSVNNPHYAAYDCGACSGRPGSVNSRVICFMANHHAVRKILKVRDINIPDETQFMGGLHDTTRDDITFYDEETLTAKNQEFHRQNEHAFSIALDFNAKERSRRFESVNTKLSPRKIHEQVRIRSVSLFEPRPELNHATNALCIIGRREMTRNLFLDRRAFLNSFDYQVDPGGKYLLNILKAAAPVCGGINLEYFFSRVDNQKLGAGTKLPHNVMGLFGVANGIEGDLRPGLPSQMIEVHDPLRLLMVVEHFPEVVLTTIQLHEETYAWFLNEWVRLVVINPETRELFLFKEGSFIPYHPLKNEVETITDIMPLVETQQENIPIYHLAHKL